MIQIKFYVTQIFHSMHTAFLHTIKIIHHTSKYTTCKSFKKIEATVKC